jgi:hypothetical protein
MPGTYDHVPPPLNATLGMRRSGQEPSNSEKQGNRPSNPRHEQPTLHPGTCAHSGGVDVERRPVWPVWAWYMPANSAATSPSVCSL